MKDVSLFLERQPEEAEGRPIMSMKRNGEQTCLTVLNTKKNLKAVNRAYDKSTGILRATSLPFSYSLQFSLKLCQAALADAYHSLSHDCSPGCNSPEVSSCEAPGDSGWQTVGRKGSGPSRPGLHQSCGWCSATKCKNKCCFTYVPLCKNQLHSTIPETEKLMEYVNRRSFTLWMYWRRFLLFRNSNIS